MIKLYNNPEYDANADDLETFHEMFEGDQTAMKKPKYLWLHELEMTPKGQKLRKIREQRSSYTNWAEVLVSVWTSIAFRKDPIISKEVSDLLGDNIDNVDGEGTSLISFIREKIVQNSFVYGRPIIRVSAMGDTPLTKQDEITSIYRPFMEIIDPRTFKDWGVENTNPNRLNSLRFCRIEYTQYEERNSSSDKPKESVYSKEYIMVEGVLNVVKYQLMKNDHERKENGQDEGWKEISREVLTDWDEIPIVANLNGQSWLREVAPHILKYYNTESVIDNIILFQAHQRIFFAGDLENTDLISLAEYAINTLPTGTAITVVNPTDTSSIDNRLGKILSNIFRIGLNMLKMQLEGAGVESADTLVQAKDSAIALVQAEIESVENITNEAIRLWAKYLGQDDFQGKIQFSIEDAKQSIDDVVKLVSVFRDEVSKLPQTRKALLHWFIEKLDLENKEELTTEIDDIIDSEPEADTNLINQRLLEALNGQGQDDTTDQPAS